LIGPTAALREITYGGGARATQDGGRKSSNREPMTFLQRNLDDQTQVLDAAIELLANYQSEYGVKAIDLNLLPNGDIEVSIMSSAGRGEARVPYGRIDKFTKRLLRTMSRT
jgi:hypothetical protein